MSKIRFDEKFSFKKFLSGKGFYVALAVCLVAVCGVAAATFMDSFPGLTRENPSPSSQSATTPLTTAATKEKPVDIPVTNVPDDRPVTTPATAGTTIPDVQTNVVPADLFVLPMGNEVAVEYSDGRQVYSKTMEDWRTHNGVDFRGEKGQQIKALADGTVLAVTDDALWGKTLTIDHGFGIHSRYCGLQSALKKGDKVKVSAVIGTLSDIPCETMDAPHLHLEITVNNEYTDPIEAIGREVKKPAAVTAKK